MYRRFLSVKCLIGFAYTQGHVYLKLFQKELKEDGGVFIHLSSIITGLSKTITFRLMNTCLNVSSHCV